MNDEPETECGWTCEACLNPQPAGSPVHTATARSRDPEEDDEHERVVSWCEQCDARSVGLGRGMGRTVTTVHRCGCSACVERERVAA